MIRTLALAVAIATSQANALLRFSCSQLVVERLDPLRTPGEVAPHLHQIVGGNAFNVTMDPNNDLPALSTCTTCTFTEDFSNYWTAVLFFRHSNGTFKQVPIMPGQGNGNTDGGMTVYYHPGERLMSNPIKVTAFKKGFRMIVGDAMTRSMDSSSPEAKALSFRCFSSNFGNNRVAPGDGLNDGSDFYQLPSMACTGGIRSQIYFPTCWNGKDLDTPDHKSYVTYKVSGNCPSSHPVAIPQLFLETVWDTREFNSLWSKDTAQPFVFSMGDPGGYGQHADYVFGWKGDALQTAMDNCHKFADRCTQLTTQSIDASNKCTQAAKVDEDIDGWLNALPGCNPVQDGPGRAIPSTGCNAPTTFIP